MQHLHAFSGALGLAMLSIAGLQSIIITAASSYWRWRAARPAAATVSRAVTILKPLCGCESGLYENLRSFCRQDFPEFQIVFGLCDAADPALPIVGRLIEEFPNVHIDVVVNPAQHGSNRKISSLINMLAVARHEILVMADSDARVGPDYLRAVIAPLEDPRVGLVSCIYRGLPTDRVWSRLGAMYINDWYVPSILFAWCIGQRNYVSGQTVCLRRAELDRLGGLAALANYLADDYQLGEMVRNSGMRIVLSQYVPQAVHHEPTLAALVRHEVRWMRTILLLKPMSFRFLFLTFTVPMALVGLPLAVSVPPFAPLALGLFATVMIMRLILHVAYRKRADPSMLADLWLIFARDVLLCWVWGCAFRASDVTWRGVTFKVQPDGTMRQHIARG